MVLLCTRGSGVIVTGIEEVCLQSDTSVRLFGDTSLVIKDCTTDFVIRMWEVDEDILRIYKEVVSVIPPSLEYFIMNMPAYRHEPGDISLEYVRTSMDMAKLLSAEMHLPSAIQRIRMFAKS